MSTNVKERLGLGLRFGDSRDDNERGKIKGGRSGR